MGAGVTGIASFIQYKLVKKNYDYRLFSHIFNNKIFYTIKSNGVRMGCIKKKFTGVAKPKLSGKNRTNLCE